MQKQKYTYFKIFNVKAQKFKKLEEWIEARLRGLT